jgi:hypothetical protein
MIQRGMDVFTLDVVYVGTVVHVSQRPHRATMAPPPRPVPIAMGSGSQGAHQFSGEVLGPAPTAQIGNTGPSRQSRNAGFAANEVTSSTPGGGRSGYLVVVRLPVAQQWRAGLPSVRRLPLDLIQVVSLERVILSVTATVLARR